MAFFQLDAHLLHSDDGIIHQKPQGNNQGSQGDFVQVDAEDVHAAEDSSQHQRNAASHHHAGADAQAHEADCQHDDDGFPEGADKIINGLGYYCRLVGNLMDFQPGCHF